MYLYVTNFNLCLPVNDFKAAKEFLGEDNITQYLITDSRGISIASELLHIEFVLSDFDFGRVYLLAKRKLTHEELADVSRWVSGQASDGLGESFEQQDFAYNNGYVCSFDWRDNSYAFSLINDSISLEDAKQLFLSYEEQKDMLCKLLAQRIESLLYTFEAKYLQSLASAVDRENKRLQILQELLVMDFDKYLEIFDECENKTEDDWYKNSIERSRIILNILREL